MWKAWRKKIALSDKRIYTILLLLRNVFIKSIQFIKISRGQEKGKIITHAIEEISWDTQMR